jgi:hypothetical protein
MSDLQLRMAAALNAQHYSSHSTPLCSTHLQGQPISAAHIRANLRQPLKERSSSNLNSHSTPLSQKTKGCTGGSLRKGIGGGAYGSPRAKSSRKENGRKQTPAQHGGRHRGPKTPAQAQHESDELLMFMLEEDSNHKRDKARMQQEWECKMKQLDRLLDRYTQVEETMLQYTTDMSQGLVDGSIGEHVGNEINSLNRHLQEIIASGRSIGSSVTEETDEKKQQMKDNEPPARPSPPVIHYTPQQCALHPLCSPTISHASSTKTCSLVISTPPPKVVPGIPARPNSPWIVDQTSNPTPDITDLNSPVIQLLLESWTTQPALREQFSGWVQNAIRSKGHRQLDPLVLSRLPPEVSIGFTTLLFPVLRERYQVHCQLHKREWQETFTDLKITAGPVPSTAARYKAEKAGAEGEGKDSTPFRRLFAV